jgi:hypothetical protein
MYCPTEKPRPLVKKRGNLHELKLAQPYYNQVKNESKRFEVRKNDRDFKISDHLLLREWSEVEGYSGNYLICEVLTILENENYCKRGYIIMSISLLCVCGVDLGKRECYNLRCYFKILIA